VITRSLSGVWRVVACAAAALWLVPYAWMFSTSFKTLPEIIAGPPAFLPRRLDFGAYREVFAAMPVFRTMAITVFVAGSIGVAQVALALPAGYALAKLRFVGRRAAALLVLACLLVPAPATFVPVFLFFAKVHLVSTIAALVVPFAASALGTLLVAQAVASVPDAIIEAARLDGASEAVIVYRILGPAIRPTLVALLLVSFVFHYNDYFWPLVMTTDDSVRTLPLGVALLREQGTGARWHIVMAGNVVLSAPILALFAAAQKHLMRAVRG
jgi:sn-glycerol 3-phosphate transport system permease protein